MATSRDISAGLTSCYIASVPTSIAAASLKRISASSQTTEYKYGELTSTWALHQGLAGRFHRDQVVKYRLSSLGPCFAMRRTDSRKTANIPLEISELCSMTSLFASRSLLSFGTTVRKLQRSST